MMPESDIQTLWEYNKLYECAVISAFREARECGFGAPYSEKENQARTKSLTAKLKSQGYKVFSLTGENLKDLCTGKRKSLFVINTLKNEYFMSLVEKLGEEFEQDSILFIQQNAVGGEGQAFLIGTNHCANNEIGYGKKHPFKWASPRNASQLYSTIVNGKPVFLARSCREVRSPGNIMGIWAMHLTAKEPWEKLLE
ncbi:MAG: hypothetical protein ACOC24_07530 [Desulfovibrionales bacterium]